MLEIATFLSAESLLALGEVDTGVWVQVTVRHGPGGPHPRWLALVLFSLGLQCTFCLLQQSGGNLW